MSTRPRLTLIAAVSEDGFISRGQGVPWDLPRDRVHFRSATAGKWLLLGRRTYDEMIGWFRDHTPLVLTRDPTFVPPIGKAVLSVAQALDLAAEAGVEEIFVCGGSAAYELAFPHADRLLVTQVGRLLGAGAAFPKIEMPPWRLVSSLDYPADAGNAFPMGFADYRRA
ncbi:MAG: dihydrofolate reductase [Verrucomicrobiaceae bacterium]|nr:dihydrofolate reductase [Verrucomicrobiaceae bacterium]